MELVAAATMAPSMHNTQPWRFRFDPARPDDRPVRRPGAGAARWRFGWPRAAYCLRRRAVQPSPGRRRRRPPASGPADSRPGQRLLLATVRLSGPSQPQQQEIELHATIAERCTNRSPFGGRRLPPGVLAELAEAARIEGAVLHVPDRHEARRLLRLAQDAERGRLRRGFPNAEQPPAPGRCRPRDSGRGAAGRRIVPALRTGFRLASRSANTWSRSSRPPSPYPRSCSSWCLTRRLIGPGLLLGAAATTPSGPVNDIIVGARLCALALAFGSTSPHSRPWRSSAAHRARTGAGVRYHAGRLPPDGSFSDAVPGRFPPGWGLACAGHSLLGLVCFAADR